MVIILSNINARKQSCVLADRGLIH